MKVKISVIVSVSVFLFIFLSCETSRKTLSSYDLIHKPYELNNGLVSRSISFENPTGAPGEGGKTSSHLGVGRKGMPQKSIKPGETVQLCDIKGPGVIRHIWITTNNTPVNLRSNVIRVWWDDQEHPSIESPLGDFMGMSHGKVMAHQTAVHATGERAGMSFYLPMPFTRRAIFTYTNEGSQAYPLYYQIDYTLGDNLPEDVGRLHVLFRRENSTTLNEDFELLPKRTGRGRFIGSIIGIRAITGNWWGEGEVKVYMDGDTEFPTICGTGSEDYVGLSWGIQQTPYLYNGCSLDENNFITMHRWHLPDPIYWEKECRITIQQIGWSPDVRKEKGSGLYERQDDWCCATFWYEPVPSAPLPDMPDQSARTTDIWK